MLNDLFLVTGINRKTIRNKDLIPGRRPHDVCLITFQDISDRLARGTVLRCTNNTSPYYVSMLGGPLYKLFRARGIATSGWFLSRFEYVCLPKVINVEQLKDG